MFKERAAFGCSFHTHTHTQYGWWSMLAEFERALDTCRPCLGISTSIAAQT